MAGIPEDFLSQIKTTVDLTAIAAQHLQGAKRQGKIVKGCCPFHAEKTPSFQVWPDHYHCYGCGEHGDAVQFIQKVKNYTFPEAVKDLADSHGLTIPAATPEQHAAAKKRGDLKVVVASANAYFQRALWQEEGRKAREYLEGRGLTEETIRKFGLGWGGSTRGQLASALGRQDLTEKDMVAAGVLMKREEGANTTELYYNRITIPIAARNGDVVSFGGRFIDDSPGPKYVNGPETSLFSKRHMLFGLNMLGSVKTPPIVVEGYLDVVAMSQAGINGAVAPLGTAMTLDQMELLWTMHPCPILCFDGDNAGRTAAGKAVNTSLKAVGPGKSFRVAILPEPEDPDSLIKSKGADTLLEYLNKAESFASALYTAIKVKTLAEEAKGLQVGGGETVQVQSTAALSPTGKQNMRLALETAANEVKDPGTAIELHSAMLRLSVEDHRKSMCEKVTSRNSPSLGQGDGAVKTMPKSLANRTAMLLSLTLKWPEIALRNEEVLSIIPAPDRLKGLRDGIIEWSRAGGLIGDTSLRDHLEEQGLGDIAKAVLSWAAPSPALQGKSPELAAELFQRILTQGKPQYKAWSALIEARPDRCGLEGTVQGASVERRGGYAVSQIRELVQAPTFG